MSSGDFSEPKKQRKPGGTGGSSRVYLHSGFSCEYLSVLTGRRTCHRRSRRRAYLLCVSSGEYSGQRPQKKPGDTGGRNMVFLHCEFSCESLNYVNGRKTLYTLSRRRESHQCGFFGECSGDLPWRKICHKECRGRVVLQCLVV